MSSILDSTLKKLKDFENQKVTVEITSNIDELVEKLEGFQATLDSLDSTFLNQAVANSLGEIGLKIDEASEKLRKFETIDFTGLKNSMESLGRLKDLGVFLSGLSSIERKVAEELYQTGDAVGLIKEKLSKVDFSELPEKAETAKQKMVKIFEDAGYTTYQALSKVKQLGFDVSEDLAQNFEKTFSGTAADFGKFIAETKYGINNVDFGILDDKVQSLYDNIKGVMADLGQDITTTYEKMAQIDFSPINSAEKSAKKLVSAFVDAGYNAKEIIKQLNTLELPELSPDTYKEAVKYLYELSNEMKNVEKESSDVSEAFSGMGESADITGDSIKRLEHSILQLKDNANQITDVSDKVRETKVSLQELESTSGNSELNEHISDLSARLTELESKFRDVVDATNKFSEGMISAKEVLSEQDIKEYATFFDKLISMLDETAFKASDSVSEFKEFADEIGSALKNFSDVAKAIKDFNNISGDEIENFGEQVEFMLSSFATLAGKVDNSSSKIGKNFKELSENLFAFADNFQKASLAVNSFSDVSEEQMKKFIRYVFDSVSAFDQLSSALDGEGLYETKYLKELSENIVGLTTNFTEATKQIESFSGNLAREDIKIYASAIKNLTDFFNDLGGSLDIPIRKLDSIIEKLDRLDGRRVVATVVLNEEVK